MLLPRLLVLLPKIPPKRLLSPRAVNRVRDGRERRNTLILAGVAQEERQRTMPAHAVPRDTDSAAIELWERFKDCRGQLLCDVIVHVVTLVVGFLCGVDVETGTSAKVPRVVFAGDVEAAFSTVRYSHFTQWDYRGYDVRGLVSGYKTAIPFLLAPCWKKPFSEQLSAVQVRPER